MSLSARVIAVVTLVGVVVGIVAGIKTVVGDGNDSNPPTPPSRAEPTGQIVTPASGTSVGRDIVARGTLADIPTDQHVWVVIRDGSLLYPQNSEITPPDGKWSLPFHQGGATKVISLELYRMGAEGNRLITGRLERKDFSGIRWIPGARRLDVVENLRIRG
jgi:hypothetical protein